MIPWHLKPRLHAMVDLGKHQSIPEWYFEIVLEKHWNKAKNFDYTSIVMNGIQTGHAKYPMIV